jgi:transcriptional regulator with XRE-family HTH domain
MYVFCIKKLRKSKGISLTKLHNLSGVSKSYLSDLENNRTFNPTMFILKKIAQALKVDIKDLFYSFKDIETLKQEMYIKIDKYGINSKAVLEISQIIDLLVNLRLQEIDINKKED